MIVIIVVLVYGQVQLNGKLCAGARCWNVIKHQLESTARWQFLF